MVGRLKGHEVLVPLKTRFSTLRFSKAVKNLTTTQIGHIHKYDLQNLLLICEHFSVPINLLQWVLDHMDYAGVGIFRQKKKVIHLRREMVTQVFGIRSGVEPFPLSTTDPLVEQRVQELRSYYQCGGKDIAIKNIILLMEKDESEEGFIRSFLFLFFTCIFCPTTHNYAYWKFLYGLHDISKVKSYDLAQLCIDHLMREIVKHHEKLLDNRTRIVQRAPEDQVGPDQMFVGGCLPLIAILYMDFLDLKVAARKHMIDYSVPRIAHVKNKDFDFVYLADLDRNSSKKLKLGALPFRDISETPYSARALMLAEEKWLKLGPNAAGIEVDCGQSSKCAPTAMSNPSKERVLELISEVVSKHENLWRIAHEQHVSGLLAELGSVISSCFPDSGGCSSQVPGTVQDSVARTNATQDSGQVFPEDAATPSAEGVKSLPSRIVVEEVLTPQQDLGKESGSTPVSVINIPSTTVAKVLRGEAEVQGDVGAGIHIAMSYANGDDESPRDDSLLLADDTLNLAIESTGLSTIDKRNRKKRAVKVLSPEKKVSKLEVEDKVKEFYNKYLRNIFFKSKDIPVVVDVNNHTVPYDKFYSSFKSIGEIDDECMNAYVQVFNSENSEALPNQRNCSKYCFTSYFTSKLLVDPKKFSFASCKKELTRISKEVNLLKCDMLFFPDVNEHHWTLFCINNLYNQVNFFDSAGISNEDDVKRQMNNLKVNFSRLCKVVEPKMRDVSSFSEFIPTGYPHQVNLHDCGFFTILYMLYWDGRSLRDFEIDILSDFRQITAYSLGKSTLNKVDIDEIAANEKKRKRK